MLRQLRRKWTPLQQELPPTSQLLSYWTVLQILCSASISCLVFLHTPVSYGSSSQEQEVELHQSSSTSITLFVRLVSVWIFCYLYCQIIFPLTLFFQGLSITDRPLFQCLICVERYLAVVHPVIFLKYKPLRYRVICCTLAWIITLVSCLICLIILLFSNITMHAWFFSMQFIVYLPIQLFFLVAVLRALKQSGPGERGRDEKNHMKRRAFYLILITTVNMTITYLPTTISVIFTIVIHQFSVIFWVPSMICYVLAGFVQPIIYLHRAKKLSCACSQ